MNITVNKTQRVLDGDSHTVASVVNACGFPSKGIAVAINGKVVRRSAWEETAIADGDSLTVIQAVCGG